MFQHKLKQRCFLSTCWPMQLWHCCHILMSVQVFVLSCFTTRVEVIVCTSPMGRCGQAGIFVHVLRAWEMAASLLWFLVIGSPIVLRFFLSRLLMHSIYVIPISKFVDLPRDMLCFPSGLRSRRSKPKVGLHSTKKSCVCLQHQSLPFGALNALRV